MAPRSSDDGGADGAKATRRPADTALKQQRMKSWQPILDPFWVIMVFFGLGVVFVPTGVTIREKADKIVEVEKVYDSYDGTHSGNCGIGRTANKMYDNGTTCQLTLDVPKDMSPPITIHYELDGFYQNHRRYARSRDDYQLLGSLTQTAVLERECKPLNKLGNTKINPCGLIANTLFNDVIKLTSAVDSDGREIETEMIEDGIAWQSDIDWKFAQPDGFDYEKCSSCDGCSCDGDKWSCTEPYRVMSEDGEEDCYRYFYPEDDTTQYLYETYPMVVSPIEGVLSEHFIVWMRTAALSPFRKLYGYIEDEIPAGAKLTFEIQANFEVVSFEGSKALIMSTNYIFGGKNKRLGTFFLAIGCICLILAGLFGAKHLFRPRKLADKKYLRYKED